MRIFVEATGSLVSNGLIGPIKESGHVCVASDASPESVGRFLADEFFQVPLAASPSYIPTVMDLLEARRIDLVLPTLDDALLKWADARDELTRRGIVLALSDRKTLAVCRDKWQTYCFFQSHGIPTPKTSLRQEYPLLKPRDGRGGSGIRLTEEPADMTGMISQEFLEGEEYSIDVFCGLDHRPVYIVPRKRLAVREGKSTAGLVVDKPEMEALVRRICAALPFTGAVNMQCFETREGIFFTEINPRIGGGTVLAMRATENWIPLTVEIFANRREVKPSRNVKYGLKMARYYAEVYYR